MEDKQKIELNLDYPVKLVLFDTETTWLDKDKRMIQLAYKVIVLDKWEKKVVKTFNKLFKTWKKIAITAMATHHITEEMVEEEGVFLEDYKEEIEKDFENAILIAHNADFDRWVIDYEEIDHSKAIGWIDTYKVAYDLIDYEDVENHKLQYLRYYLGLERFWGINHKEIDPHDALSDVLILEALFFFLIALYQKRNPDYSLFNILEDFINISNREILLRTLNFGILKWYSFEEILSWSSEEYIIKNPKARYWSTGADYLHWLMGQELNKPEDEQNKNLIYTIKFYISHPPRWN